MLPRLLAAIVTAAPACAAADGVSLFGDARLGLGYNIGNEGNSSGTDSVRAVSRVRFGVTMSGAAGRVSFGGKIRADNSQRGEGGAAGQTAGSVFSSGAWGSVTFGDTSGADETWVGDVPGNLSLTDLGDLHETPFISNGGSFGTDVSNNFAANPDARPTVRYDLDIGSFGLSLSSNRDLTDVQLGGGYSGPLAGGQWILGLGYNDFAGFTSTGAQISVPACLPDDPAQPIVLDTGSCPEGTAVELSAREVGTEVPAGRQWSAGVMATYASVALGVTYSNAQSDGDAAFQSLAFGGTVARDAATLGAYWQGILTAEGSVAAFDGESTFGLTAEYDLGGGATLAGGAGRTFAQREVAQDGTVIESARAAETVADFGIRMSF